MTFESVQPGHPRRPAGPRNSGDAWVVSASGERYWGRYGAAGLLAVDAERGVLLQHRVEWSHHGDTWALPGGARHEGEAPVAAALREAGEEAGVPAGAVRPRLLSVLDLGVWSYTTVVGDVTVPFEATISDPESRALAWVPAGSVSDYPLHPGFAASWRRLQPLLTVRPVIVIDAANVVGSVPDGWWRDRPGAAGRLLNRIATLAARGVAADSLGLPEDTWFPDWLVVLEGRAAAAADVPGVGVVRAAGAGDDGIVAEAERLVRQGRPVVAVTSDRGLTARLVHLGVVVHGVRWLLEQLG